MTAKLKFEDQLAVIRVRKNYAAPYLKQKYVYIDKKDIKNEKSFVTAMNERIKNWPDGIYFLKLSNGKVLTRFKVESGTIQQIFRTSPATGFKYPIYDLFIKRKQ